MRSQNRASPVLSPPMSTTAWRVGSNVEHPKRTALRLYSQLAQGKGSAFDGARARKPQRKPPSFEQIDGGGHIFTEGSVQCPKPVAKASVPTIVTTA